MNRHHILRAAALGVALALGGATSHAQPILAVDTVPAVEKATIKVNNVSVGVLAYWLDPQHNSAPIQLEINRKNSGQWTSDVVEMTRQPGNGNGPRGLKMPAGIESIEAIAPQNLLLVKGTAAGIEALRKLVTEIDVPVGQVEIEAQIWEVAPAEFARLPLDFRNASRLTAPFGDTLFDKLAFAPPEDDISPIARQLQFWQTTERARIITAPRVTALDGLAASLASTETRGFNVNAMKDAQPEAPQPEAPQPQAPQPQAADDGPAAEATPVYMQREEKPDDNWEWGKSRIQSQVALNAMPVLHGDLVALAFQIVLNNDVSQASTIMRNGETLAVRLSHDSPKGWARVALIKVRIIRRAGDEFGWKTGPFTAF